MIKTFRNLLTSQKKPKARMPCVPNGTRYYVIGDIHGRLDLYQALIAGIDADDARAGKADTHVVLLGDLVDRGPESAGVIKATREWQTQRRVRVLAGNHEDMFLTAFEKPDVLRHFIRHGGRETILSYGLDPDDYDDMTIGELFEAYPKYVPQEDRDYVAGFEDSITAGDYLFVHAGIDPALPLDQQNRKDLLWIRDKFLNYNGPLAKVVVHGHTIFESVMDCGNRIGIDTGAFRSGVLTALVLEGDQRRVMQAIAPAQGSIEVVHSDVLT